MIKFTAEINENWNRENANEKKQMKLIYIHDSWLIFLKIINYINNTQSFTVI